MWVKICGTTNLEDALLAVDAGAAAVGFVLAPSRRRVTAEQVREIGLRLPKDILKVGVYTSTDAAEILASASAAGLDVVQLQSAYALETVQAVLVGSAGKLRVLQVVDFPAAAEPDAQGVHKVEQVLRAMVADGVIDDVLLDTSVKGASGGTGIVFDWSRAAEMLSRAWPREASRRLGLAGGLRPENIAAAIQTLHPDFVDVVSGVEASPGKKDAARVRDFISRAHDATDSAR